MDWKKWNTKRKLTKKKQRKEENIVPTPEYINSCLQSGAEKWNPADIAQIITSVTAEMEKDEKAVREWTNLMWAAPAILPAG